MKRRFWAVLLLVLVVAVLLRTSTVGVEYDGYDAYVHDSIVRQGAGGFGGVNHLDRCPNGVDVAHPAGFYLVPSLLANFLPVRISLGFSTILFSLAGLMLLFYFMKMLVSARAGLVAVSLVSFSVAHFTRSHAASFRGDVVAIPFILGALICLYRAFEFSNSARGSRWAFATAFISAFSIAFWPGGIYVLLLIQFCAIVWLWFSYLAGHVEQSTFSSISLIVVLQIFFAIVLGSIFDFPYVSEFLTASIASLISLAILGVSKDYATKVRMCVSGLLILIGSAFAVVLRFTSGFGWVVSESVFQSQLSELRAVSLPLLWEYFSFSLVFGILGAIFVVLKSHRSVSARFFLVALLPSLYLLLSSVRYAFLGSVLFVASAGFLAEFSAKRVYRVVLIVLVVATCVSGIFDIHAYASNDLLALDEDSVSILSDLRNSGLGTSCVASMVDNGGYIQYYAEKPSYLSSVNQLTKRFDKVLDFLFEDGELSTEFFFWSSYDMRKVEGYLDVSNYSRSSNTFLRLVPVGEDQLGLFDSAQGRFTIMNVGGASVSEGPFGPIAKIAVGTGGNVVVHEQVGQGCAYLSRYSAFYMDDDLCESNFGRIVMGRPLVTHDAHAIRGDSRLYSLIQ